MMDWLAPKSPREVKLRIFTFKQGLLSAVGHHLCFSAPAVLSSSCVDQETELEVVVRPQDLKLLGAVEAPATADLRSFDLDVPSITEMSRQDERKIMRAALGEVLEVERFPSLRWQGRLTQRDRSDTGFTLNGLLSLHGQVEPQAVEVCRGPEGALAVAEIQPSRWRIPPYTAMLGALRLQDRVWLKVLSSE